MRKTIQIKTDIFQGEASAPEGKAVMWFTSRYTTEIRAVLPSWNPLRKDERADDRR